ncbi:MAG: hypothetical protein MUO23_08470 [Anaerolineales bacterium]|nr:hypothetical protein [Anaerolineales bacterium]
MNRWVFRGILAVLLLAMVGVGAGLYAYSLGVAQGQALASGGGVALVPAGVAAYPTGLYMPGGFLVSCLVPLFVLFAGLAFLRLAFGPRHMGHGMWDRGGRWEGDLPPMFRSWHDRAHSSHDEANPGGSTAP